MNNSDYRGFSVIQGDRISTPPNECFLSAIGYRFGSDSSITIGFAMFEAREEPRNSRICFAPHLDLVESIAAATNREPVKHLLDRVQPILRSMFASVTPPDFVLFPQAFNIPPDLRITPLQRLTTYNFEAECQHQLDERFRDLRLCGLRNPWRNPKTHGYSYLKQVLRAAFVRLGIWRRREMQKKIPVEGLSFGDRPFSVYLGYRNVEGSVFRMLQPVSLVGKASSAQFLAQHWPQIQRHFEGNTGPKCEMYAIVEDSIPRVNRSSIEARLSMEKVGIRVDPASRLPELAVEAQSALGLG